MDKISFNKIKGAGFASILVLSILAPQYTADANTDEQWIINSEENTSEQFSPEYNDSAEEYQTEEPYYNEETSEENFYDESDESYQYNEPYQEENPYAEPLPENPSYGTDEEIYEDYNAETNTYQNFTPELYEASVSGQAFEPGDTVTLTFSGVSYNNPAGATATFQSDSGSGQTTLDITYFDITLQEDGSFSAVGTYQIPEDFEAASYSLDNITLNDEFGNYSEIPSENAGLNAGFDITDSLPDDAAPELRYVYTDKGTYAPGDTVTVTVEAADEGEINQAWGSFADANGDFENIPFQINTMQMTQNTAGNFVGTATFVIDEEQSDATYQLNRLSLTDVHGNQNHLNNSTRNLGVTFEVVSETESDPPELVDVSVDKDLYKVGETVNVTITAKDENEVIGVTANFAAKNGDGEEVYSTDLTGIEEDEDGNYVAEATLHIPDKLSSSTVQLENVNIVDIHENAGEYDAADYEAGLTFTVAEIVENAPSPDGDSSDSDEAAAAEEEESAGGILPDTGIFSEQVVLPVLVLLIFGVTVLLATLRMRKTN